MKDDITIRTYRAEDLPALVEMINDANAVDCMERWTTMEELGDQMTWPGYNAETDCFLGLAGGRLAGFADIFMRAGETGKESTCYSWGIVHPATRRRGLGRRLLEMTYLRALDRLPEIPRGPVYFHGNGRVEEEDRKALFEGFGMAPVRYFVNLARRIDGGLPPPDLPAGYRLRALDLERDVETAWRVDVQSFADHWGFDGCSLEEFQRLVHTPHFRAELCLLAEEEAGGEVVGLGINRIDPDWIANTGRQEGHVQTLGVVREHRRRGLGSALLAHSMHLLRRDGMEAAHLHSDAENLTGAMRLYERLGFRVRKTNVAYRKVLRDA